MKTQTKFSRFVNKQINNKKSDFNPVNKLLKSFLSDNSYLFE